MSESKMCIKTSNTSEALFLSRPPKWMSDGFGGWGVVNHGCVSACGGGGNFTGQAEMCQRGCVGSSVAWPVTSNSALKKEAHGPFDPSAGCYTHTKNTFPLCHCPVPCYASSSNIKVAWPCMYQFAVFTLINHKWLLIICLVYLYTARNLSMLQRSEIYAHSVCRHAGLFKSNWLTVLPGVTLPDIN